VTQFVQKSGQQLGLDVGGVAGVAAGQSRPLTRPVNVVSRVVKTSAVDIGFSGSEG